MRLHPAIVFILAMYGCLVVARWCGLTAFVADLLQLIPSLVRTIGSVTMVVLVFIFVVSGRLRALALSPHQDEGPPLPPACWP